jgi:hypothetical protein
MTARKVSWDDGWAAGVAYAAAYLVNGHGEDCLAAMLLGDTGLTLTNFKSANVQEPDITEVERLYETDPYLGGPRP